MNPYTWTSSNSTHTIVNPSPIPIPSIEEQKRNINQLENNVFNELSLIHSNCFNTSGFDENSFNDYTKKVHFENGVQMNSSIKVNNSNKKIDCILI